MTRINCVPPEELCDRHLLAEKRELTRIPNAVASGKAKGTPGPRYTLGKGHVCFFYDKMDWLESRYLSLLAECRRRGFAHTSIWPSDLPPSKPSNWAPTEADMALNRARIQDRLSTMKSVKWTPAV